MLGALRDGGMYTHTQVRNEMIPEGLNENAGASVVSIGLFSSPGTNSICVKVGMISNKSKCSHAAPFRQLTSAAV